MQPTYNPHNDYEKLFYTSLDMLCIAGTDGYFKKINSGFSRVLGYSDEHILSTPFMDFVHPVDLDSTISEVEKLKQGEHSVNFENRYRHKDGSYRTLSWSACADPDNGLLYCVARDVTEELNTRSKLLQIERALDQGTIVSVTDNNGTIIDVNDNFCEISGYSRDELIGNNHRILKSGKHSKEFYRDMWATISSGKVWSGLIENRRKDGRHYFAVSIITPILDIHGKIENYMSIRFDTTKHIQVESELKKTLSILNETGAIAKVGGWELDVKTGELTWTDETFKILEVEKKANQKPVLPEGLQLFVDEHKPVIEQAVYRAMEYGEPYSLELQAKTAKGNVLWVYTNGKANYVDGKIVSVSGTIQDIDAQKNAEMKYEMERLKSIQTSKLASLGELAAGIAHEINNPLSIILGASQLMSKFGDDPELIRSSIDDIEKSCNRISRIVKSLKKFSRTSDRHDYAVNSLDEIVKEAVLLTSAKSKRSDTPVTFDAGPGALITCDEVEIEQVIVNLINNAIDAVADLSEKWIRLEILDDENYWLLKIMDSGIGIPSEINEKLFDPFFTTKKTGEGTGLGLSIVKGILDEHNATISIDQKSAHTCFLVRFQKYLEK